MKQEDGNTYITYKLNKDRDEYKTYINELKENSSQMDLSWESLQYFDDCIINIEIDTDGNLNSLEFSNTMAYINEGIEDFKVPQYAYIEFEYE